MLRYGAAPIFLRCFEYVVEGIFHNPITAAVYAVGRPFIAQAVLHPLEIGYGNTTGVGEDIGYNGDALFVDDGICLFEDVGPFAPSTISFRPVS